MMAMTVQVLVAAVVIFGLCGCAAPAAAEEGRQELRVLSYNIHHAEGVDGKLDLPRIANIIKESGADLVALQEVDKSTERTGRVDQAAELAKLTGMHVVFGKAMDYQGGQYGQVILSRWPILSNSTHYLPEPADREPRIAVATTIRLGAKGPVIRFVGTHLEHQLEAVRIEQATELNKLFASGDMPTLLLGDMNARPGSNPMKILLEKWQDTGNTAPTVPAENPRNLIDYVLFRPAGAWEVLSSEVLNEPVASDHRPVLAVLKLTR